MPQLRRLNRSSRNRRGLPKNDVPLQLSLVPSSIAFETPFIDLTFRVPVSLKGIPQILTNTSKLPTSATKTAPNVVRLAYDTPGSVTTATIPERDPAIRSNTGGYLTAGTFPAT
jgi:hypothetical protein